MTSRELYEQHLALAAPGTELHKAMARVVHGEPSLEDLLAFIKFELWDCIYSLPPESGAKGETNNSGEVSRVTDGWHASACAARASAALHRLREMLKAKAIL